MDQDIVRCDSISKVFSEERDIFLMGKYDLKNQPLLLQHNYLDMDHSIYPVVISLLYNRDGDVFLQKCKYMGIAYHQLALYCISDYVFN